MSQANAIPLTVPPAGSVGLTPSVRIQQAFLQLEFAIKLMNYIELRKIDKPSFDTDVTVRLKHGNLGFTANAFKSYDDLILAAQNNYQITLGCTAIALESALQDAGIPNNPSDLSPRGELRSLVYLIRCAFGHDMMTPCWKVNSRYRREFKLVLPIGKFCIDLAQLDGKPFEIASIGDMTTYCAIKDTVLKTIGGC